MIRIQSLVVAAFIFAGLSLPNCVNAEQCFNAFGKLNEDAQNIRLKAREMGWTVGKPSSLAAATIIEGKIKLYPKDNVEICLREHAEELQIKAQSKSEDAGKAMWHRIMAKRR